MKRKFKKIIALILAIPMLLLAGCRGIETDTPQNTVSSGTTVPTETTLPTQPENDRPVVTPTSTEPKHDQPAVAPSQPQESTPNEHIPGADEGEEYPLPQPEATEPTQDNEQVNSEAQVTEPETNIDDDGRIDPDQGEEI